MNLKKKEKKFIDFLGEFDKFNESISKDKSLLNDSENVIKAYEDFRQQVKNM